MKDYRASYDEARFPHTYLLSYNTGDRRKMEALFALIEKTVSEHGIAAYMTHDTFEGAIGLGLATPDDYKTILDLVDGFVHELHMTEINNHHDSKIGVCEIFLEINRPDGRLTPEDKAWIQKVRTDVNAERAIDHAKAKANLEVIRAGRFSDLGNKEFEAQYVADHYTRRAKEKAARNQAQASEPDYVALYETSKATASSQVAEDEDWELSL